MDLDVSIGQYVLGLDILQAFVLGPFEDISQMVQMIGQEAVQDMILFKKKYAILHEVIDELAKDDLFLGLIIKESQTLVDLLDGLLG